ncbi:MAG: HPr family phosphocarrier protein [Alphaproteobacteria bacterium]|nr:HPr family phosphocarrier protein [Alphaproteobacteria bacterium]
MSAVAPIVTILTIQNQKGLHARAAAKFVRIVNACNADVKVTRVNCTPPLFEDCEDLWMASGGSVLGILTLGAEKGAQIRLEATGDDAQKVVDEISNLIDRKFDEE